MELNYSKFLFFTHLHVKLFHDRNAMHGSRSAGMGCGDGGRELLHCFRTARLMAMITKLHWQSIDRPIN